MRVFVVVVVVSLFLISYFPSLLPLHSFTIYILGPSKECYFALLIIVQPKYAHL